MRVVASYRDSIADCSHIFDCIVQALDSADCKGNMNVSLGKMQRKKIAAQLSAYL